MQNYEKKTNGEKKLPFFDGRLNFFRNFASDY